MAAQGYIGRAPGESSVVVARQTFTPTGITTNFTFASGYTVGYVDAYLNGARLIEGSDYTATDGSVVGLSTNAINGDVLELVAYKAFNVSNVTGALSDFSVSGNLTVDGTIPASKLTGALPAISGANLTGVISGVELKQSGSSVGTSITAINFSGATVSAASAGLSTVTVSVSQTLTLGVRVGTAVTFGLTGSSFNVSGRGGNVPISV